MQATVGSPSQALGTFLALFLFGAAVIPFCYCLSMAFASPSAAQVCNYDATRSVLLPQHSLPRLTICQKWLVLSQYRIFRLAKEQCIRMKRCIWMTRCRSPNSCILLRR